MWFYKGVKVNIWLPTKTAVALIYKINPVQIITIIVENIKSSLNSISNTIEISNSKLWDILTHCKGKIGTFLKCHGHCYTNGINCSYAKHQKGSNWLLIYVLWRETQQSVTNTWLSLKHTLLCSMVLQTQLGASCKININQIHWIIYIISTKTHNINGSFFSYKK